MSRSDLREKTFVLLYCKEFHDRNDMPSQIAMYLENFEMLSDEDKSVIEQRALAVMDEIPSLDQKINEVANGWKTNRMSKVDLVIIRLALFEITLDDDVPTKVAINEAVELAKKYGGSSSTSFVNGILAKLV